MTDPVELFFEAWSVQDRTKRDGMIDAALGNSIFYADPRTETPLTEPTAVKDYVGAFSASAPGWPVRVVHESRTLDFIRVAVQFGEGENVQHGQYIAETDTNGRIIRLVGFVGLGAPT
jgi:hypothetical protein